MQLSRAILPTPTPMASIGATSCTYEGFGLPSWAMGTLDGRVAIIDKLVFLAGSGRFEMIAPAYWCQACVAEVLAAYRPSTGVFRF